MRKLSFSSTALLLLSIIFLLNACQKESSQVVAEINSNQAIKAKVNLWLTEQKTVADESKRPNIELLKENLDFSQLRIEKYDAGEQIIILPVRDEFKKAKHVADNKIPNLVLIMDKSGNIRKGNLVLYIPKNGEIVNKVPENAFYDIFNTGTPKANGLFKFLGIGGGQIYQLEYNNGKLISSGLMKKGSGLSNRTESEGCIDWYLVTTYYYTDGTTSQTEEYVGRTCGNNECEDVECLDPGSGGGGGGGGGDLEYHIAAFKSNFEINSASEEQSSVLLSETSDIRTKQYTWTCGKALLIKAKSLEYGTHKKVNNEWQWETLEHQSVSINGVVIGGSVSVGSNSGQATIGIYNAIMAVTYTLNYNAVIPFFSPVNWSVTKSAASHWHVSN